MAAIRQDKLAVRLISLFEIVSTMFFVRSIESLYPKAFFVCGRCTAATAYF